MANSSGLNGVSDDWDYTGTVVALQDSDTKNVTVSNSCFRLSEGASLSQTIDSIVVGSSYAVSMKVKKTSSLLAEIKLIYNGDAEAVIFSSSDKIGWTEYTAVIESIQSPVITIEMTTRESYLYVADIMICEGSVPKAWTPAPNEIYTSGAIIDKNGIEVFRSGSSEKTVITNHEFAGYYNDEKIFTVNKDETRMKKTIVDGEFTVGDCKFIPYSTSSDEGLNIALID